MKRISKKQLRMLTAFHWLAMFKFGPDMHTDGSDAMVYGVLKLLNYNVPYRDPYVSIREVEKLISDIKEKFDKKEVESEQVQTVKED